MGLINISIIRYSLFYALTSLLLSLALRFSFFFLFLADLSGDGEDSDDMANGRLERSTI